MKVYVAAPWARKAEAIAFGKRLEDKGWVVTSRWFHHEGDPNDSSGVLSPMALIQEQALEDIKDVLAADILVVLNLQKSEGKAVETGIALANKIPILSVGPRTNIFQTLGTIVETEDEAIEVLGS